MMTENQKLLEELKASYEEIRLVRVALCEKVKPHPEFLLFIKERRDRAKEEYEDLDKLVEFLMTGKWIW